MRILVANDDGEESLGLSTLVEHLVKHHVVCLAIPQRQSSGTGHGFTFTRPLGVRQEVLFDCPTWQVDGLPADAVKFALVHALAEPPDIVLAGINPGENAGVCAPYSGTVACAREAALFGIPAMALSTRGMTQVHYRAIAEWVVRVLQAGTPPMPHWGFWNVNFPEAHPSAWGEVKICRGATSMFRDKYRQVGQDLWQLEGHKATEDLIEGTDDYWLAKNCPAMVPLLCDSTHEQLAARSGWNPPPVAFA